MAGARCSEMKKKKKKKKIREREREKEEEKEILGKKVLRNLSRAFLHSSVKLNPTPNGNEGKSEARESALPTVLNRARKRIKRTNNV